MKNTKKKGFTIVELVIVIAVIGILSAILIPTFSGLVKDANDAALQQNLRNAYVQYASENAADGELVAQEDLYIVDGTTVYAYSEGTYAAVASATVSDGAVTETGYTYTSVGEYNGFATYTRAVNA